MFYRSNFKQIRKAKKITQAEIADILGKTRLTISFWETGRYNPSESDIRIVAEYLNVPVHEISDLQGVKKFSNLTADDLIGNKIEELDTLMKEFGDLPPDIIYKIKSLKSSLVSYNSSYSRLRKNALKYDLLLQHLPFIFYAKDKKLKYSYVNEAFLNLIGTNYNKEDIVGTNSLDLFGFNDYAPLHELEKEVLQKKEQILNHHITIPGSRGKRFGLLNIIPVIDDNGEVSEIMCSIRDITDSFEEQNRRKELEDITNKINHVIWMGEELIPGDPDSFKYTYVSDGALRILEIAKGEIIKDNTLWLKIVHKDDIERVTQWYKLRNFPKKIEYKIVVKSGVKLISNEVFKENGNKFYGIVTDITGDNTLT